MVGKIWEDGVPIISTESDKSELWERSNFQLRIPRLFMFPLFDLFRG